MKQAWEPPLARNSTAERATQDFPPWYFRSESRQTSELLGVNVHSSLLSENNQTEMLPAHSPLEGLVFN